MDEIVCHYINGYIQCEAFCPKCGKKSKLILKAVHNYWFCDTCRGKFTKQEICDSQPSSNNYNTWS